LELLFEVSPRLNGKNTGVCFLAKEVLGPLCGLSILEEGQGPENLFLVTAELLWGQAQIQCTGVEEGSTRASFTREVGWRGEFWPRPLFGRVARAREGGITGEGDMGIGGGATAGAGVGPVMS